MLGGRGGRGGAPPGPAAGAGYYNGGGYGGGPGGYQGLNETQRCQPLRFGVIITQFGASLCLRRL